MFYSKTTGGFYTREIHGDNIPHDAVEITIEEHAALMQGQSEGKIISGDADGYPVLADPPKPTSAEVWERIKAERERRKDGGVKVLIGGVDKWFHSDTGSRIQHLGLKDKARDLLAAGGNMADNIIILGQEVRWKTMDGSFVGVTAQLAGDIVTGAGNLDARLFVVAETHKATMEASSDPAAYDFSGGWPTIYGE